MESYGEVETEVRERYDFDLGGQRRFLLFSRGRVAVSSIVAGRRNVCMRC